MSLKQQHEDYIARLRARGDDITNYKCPECDGVIDTKAAPQGESWDTLATCPHCDGLHLKITDGSSAHGEALPF